MKKVFAIMFSILFFVVLTLSLTGCPSAPEKKPAEPAKKEVAAPAPAPAATPAPAPGAAPAPPAPAPAPAKPAAK